MGVLAYGAETDDGDETMRVLFLDRYGEGYVGAPHTFYEFMKKVEEQADCVFAGEDYPLFREESVDDTVKRVMPDADWVIVDRDKLPTVKKAKHRSYRVGVFLSDLHGKWSHNIPNPTQFRDYLNTLNYDAFFLKYAEIHGCGVTPHLFTEGLKGKAHHLPWSVDCKKHNWKHKKYDVAFIGSATNVYPLRQKIHEGLYHASKGYRVVCCTSPKGKTYERKWDVFKNEYVGQRYVDLLNETRIMIFGCSKYRYPVQKYFESTASACLVLSDEPSTAKKLGFVDGETYININEFDWETTLTYCLENPDTVKHITRAGLKNTLINHSHEKRVKEWLKMLEA